MCFLYIVSLLLDSVDFEMLWSLKLDNLYNLVHLSFKLMIHFQIEYAWIQIAISMLSSLGFQFTLAIS